jgi:ribosomal protein S18 acetylase RimI-like enzyme
VNLTAPHILDNPIWQALHTSNKHFAFGNEQAKYLKRDVGLFAGLRSNSESELTELYSMLPTGSGVILFVPGGISVSPHWHIKLQREILQMTYDANGKMDVDNRGIIPLTDENIPAMLELTHMTNPGPFFSRTIDFGNYEGIFENGQLVSMAGQRLQPDPFVEISAVCTHPAHTGKGYAAKLIKSQLSQIISRNKIHFLHLYPDNLNALSVYKKLGFTIRKPMMVYFLQKNN